MRISLRFWTWSRLGAFIVAVLMGSVIGGVHANAATLTSTYPGGVATSFSTGVGDWTHTTQYGALCGLTPGVLCPAINGTFQPANGNAGAADGFLRDASTGLLMTPIALGSVSTGIWTSPEFTYTGAQNKPAEQLRFSLSRKSNISDLLSMANAGWKVDLVKSSDSSVTPLIAEGAATNEAAWASAPGGSLATTALTTGSAYRIRITTFVSTSLLGVLPAGSFEYDDVALVASRTSGGPTGPTGPTSPTGPTGPTGPTKPGTTPPNGSTAIFDGKVLYLRLKCPARFKPKCLGKAVGVTKKSMKRRLAKPTTASVSASQKAKRWKVAKLKVRPKFRSLIAGYAKRPTAKLLVIRQTIKAKRFKHGKKQTVFHKYRVRTAK